MKRILSLLLCAVILFAVPTVLIPEVSAANDYKMILSFDKADDVSVLNHKWGSTQMTSENANSDYTKLSKYSAHWSTKAGPYFNWKDQNIDITDYKYINFWIYSDKDLSVYATMNVSGYGSTLDTVLSAAQGWNLVSAALNSNGAAHHNFEVPSYSTAIKSIGFSTERGLTIPEGCSNAGTKISAQSGANSTNWYIDSIFLTKNTIDNNDFTATTIQNGDSKVLPDIRGDKTIKFNAPGLNSAYLNVNNVSVSYCEEGTHDEANHSAVPLTPGTDYTLGYETDTLKLIFTNSLLQGTTYDVHIGGQGFLGALALRFNNYDLSFRTLGEGENIPPQVKLIDLESNERFFPSEDDITLKAEASDANGTVEKLEFYAGDTLLGEGTAGTGDDSGIYTFVWENPIEDVNGCSITAIAYDNDGDFSSSEAVSILVLDKKNPEVSLTSPTGNVVVSRNFDGVVSAANLTVSADVICAGSTPAEVEFVLNNDTLHTATDVADSYSYTFTDLPLGEYVAFVRVTDEFGMQGVSESVLVEVKDFAKVNPGLFEEDFEGFNEGEKIDWTLSGKAVTLTATNYGGNTVAKLATEHAAANETVYTQKRYRNALIGSPWEASVRLNFGDMAFERKAEISGASEGLVLNFKTDGGVYVGSEKKAEYRPGEWYDVKIVVNPEKNTLHAIFDDVIVASKTGLNSNYSQSGATIRVSQDALAGKSGYVLLDDAGIYQISQTRVEAIGITVYDGETAATDLDIIPVSADSLTISLNEAMGDSLKNNVWVIDTAESRKIALNYDNNKVYFDEELRGNREYKVVVTTGVSGVSGQAIATNQAFTFKTAPKDGEVTEANFSVGALSSSVSSVTCELPFVNHSGTEHNMQVVAIVYNGKSMQNIVVQPVTVGASTPSATLSVTVPISDYNSNARVKVFVVDDLENMTPVSETIYSIK